MATSTIQQEPITVTGTRVGSVQEISAPKSKDLATTLYYYDEAADKAKVAEPIDPEKEQPKVYGLYSAPIRVFETNTGI